MGRLSASVLFLNIDGGIMFKVFVGRDEKRELLADSTGEVSRLDGTPGRRGLADDGRARPARARQFIPIAEPWSGARGLSEWSGHLVPSGGLGPYLWRSTWPRNRPRSASHTQKCKRRCSKSKTIFARTSRRSMKPQLKAMFETSAEVLAA